MSFVRRKVKNEDIEGGISFDKLASNTIYIRVLGLQLESKSGLAADSTGVKASSPVFKVSGKHLKALVLRASITSIPSDAVVRVKVYNVSAGADVGYVEFSGATGEDEVTITSGLPSDGDLIRIDVEVTTASGTAGATFDLGYATLMIDYGVS